MNLDSFTVTALADEFRLTIMGGRVQNIVQMTSLTFGLEFYAQQKRQYLILSAEPQAPRAHLQTHKPRRGEGNETPLLQLFRKYVRGSGLMTIEQPAYERILLFHFSGQNGEITLILEIIAGRSNLIFTDPKGRILGLARPLPANKPGSRVLLPNHAYTPLPAQEKLTVEAFSLEKLGAILTGAKPDARLDKLLVANLTGLSPLIAREIVFRVCGQTDTPVSQVTSRLEVLQAIRSIYAHITEHRWEPHTGTNEAGEIDAVAAIALTHRPDTQPADSISGALEAAFSQLPIGPADDYSAARQPVAARIKKDAERLSRRLKKLNADATALKDPESFKQRGDAILAYSYQIKPRQTELEVPWLDETPLAITLDPERTAPENAQRYYARYQKAKRAAEIIPQQREIIRLQTDYLEQLTLDLELANTRPEIDAVAAALRETAPGKKTAKKQQAPSRPQKYISPDGSEVWVGKNARQNHHITFTIAAPNDIWLHARGVPGSHVVVSTAKGDASNETILWAAKIAAYFSKSQSEKYVEVSYTFKKHVRAIKGAPPGLVSVQNEKTVRVSPLKP